MASLRFTENEEIEMESDGAAALRALDVLAQRDPFIRANSVRWTPSSGALADTAGVIRTDAGALIASGDVPEIARLIAQMDLGKLRFALTPIGTLEYAGDTMRDRFGLVDGGTWVWMHSRTLPPATPGEEHVSRLDGRFSEIAETIAESNPETSAAEDIEEHEWWGYQRDGRLLGVCGIDNYGVQPGTPEGARHGVHLSGLGTRPEARRQGVGAAMMAAITRHFVGEFGLVHYGVWDTNHAALRIYRRLGYSTGAHIQNFVRGDS